DKTSRLLPEIVEQLEAIKNPQKWLVITEGWCGDAAQIIPVLVKLAEVNPLVEIRFILREEQPAVMDAFLTNGARSIPKIIVLDEQLEVQTTWGPRPVEVQTEVMRLKAALAEIEDEDERKLQNEESKKFVQKWYTKDKGRSIQREFVATISAGIPAVV
ncbi:MAG: thioredoxin family protein, partial [Saprospiraceae bacterium]